MRDGGSNIEKAEIEKRLRKYHYESSQKDYCVWEVTEELRECIVVFRLSVLREKWEDVHFILKILLTEDKVVQLLPLLTAHPSLETWKEALLLAITTGSRPVVEFILSLFVDFPGEETKGPKHSCRFPPHMTPLMLACIYNNFAIVECLLLRGHTIILPHRADCCCSECLLIEITASTQLERFDTYKAICSDAFLWLGCSDPLLTACLLNKEIEVGISIEQEYKECYLSLQNSIMTFSLYVVGQCWTMEEIKILLMQKRGVFLADCDSPLPRIRLALNTHMKYLVSSLTVQNALKDLWIGKLKTLADVTETLSQSTTSGSMDGCWRSISKASLIQLMKVFDCPKTRYMGSFISYLLFLSILVYLRYPGRVKGDAVRRSLGSGYGRLVLEAYVYLYALGMFVEHYLGLMSRGMIRFYEMWWRWFDVIFFWLFFGSFYCHLMTAASIHQDGLERMHRKHWIFSDFSIVYDIYFGGACIMAFWRIFYFVQLNRSIGVKVISVGQCVYHVVTFLWIMAVVGLCFAVGINMIYESYTGNVAQSSNGLIHMKDTFSTVILTFRILYWAFYGYLGPWDYALVVGNSGPKQEEVFHLFTVLAGEVIVGIYHIAVILGLVNLMISFLVHTADDIQLNEDIEWKYTRCHIYAEYMEWYTAFPPPLNIFYIIFIFASRIFKSSTYSFSFSDVLTRLNLLPIDEQNVSQLELEHEALLLKLFNRYRNWIKLRYDSALRMDADAILKGSSKELVRPEPILAFMNKEDIVRNEALEYAGSVYE